jgi:hypothetical protein
VAVVSVCILHVIFIDSYTSVFYMIYKWDISPFQCKANLNQSVVMKEMDSLRHILIDFYVLVLTPQLHRSGFVTAFCKHNIPCVLWHIYMCKEG